MKFPDAHLPFLRKANGRPAKPLAADDVKPMPWIGVDSARLREQVANYYNCLDRLDAGVGLLLKELSKAESQTTPSLSTLAITERSSRVARARSTKEGCEFR